MNAPESDSRPVNVKVPLGLLDVREVQILRLLNACLIGSQVEDVLHGEKRVSHWEDQENEKRDDCVSGLWR